MNQANFRFKIGKSQKLAMLCCGEFVKNSRVNAFSVNAFNIFSNNEKNFTKNVNVNQSFNTVSIIQIIQVSWRNNDRFCK